MNLYNEDCLETMKMMADGCVDIIVTDPPYDIPTTDGGGTINSVKKLSTSLKELDDANITNGYDIEKFGTEFLRIMKEPNIYLWCNKKQIPEYFDFYVNKHKCKFEILVWNKPNALPTYSNKYLSDKEYCLYFFKGKGKTCPKSYEDAKTVYIAPINHKDKKLYHHPTIKPLGFTEKLIRNSSQEGQVVFDPFMGSGTTGVAAVNTNRGFIGCEIDFGYYKTAEERIRAAMESVV